MSKKRSARYVGNTPGYDLKPKKRKGSRNNYRPPADVRQTKKDQAYVAFQQTPHLNEQSKKLVRDKPRCDTILGGKEIWLHKERPNGDKFKFTIIVDGQRCPNEANRTFRQEGKNIRRCADHSRSDFWIPEDD
jgi:hypothetical protein